MAGGGGGAASCVRRRIQSARVGAQPRRACPSHEEKEKGGGVRLFPLPIHPAEEGGLLCFWGFFFYLFPVLSQTVSPCTLTFADTMQKKKNNSSAASVEEGGWRGRMGGGGVYFWRLRTPAVSQSPHLPELWVCGAPLLPSALNKPF